MISADEKEGGMKGLGLQLFEHFMAQSEAFHKRNPPVALSADETIRRADECLDQWRALTKEAQDYARSDYHRRLADLGYPPDVITRWLDAKRAPGVRKAAAFTKRPVWPLTA